MSRVTANPLKVVPSAAAPLTITTGGAFTYSAWTQVIASTATAIQLAGVVVYDMATSDEADFDFGVGASGSEVSISTLRFMGGGASGGLGWYMLPVPLHLVPLGSRLSVRYSNRNAGDDAKIAVLYYENLDASLRTTSPLTAFGLGGASPSLTTNVTPWANSAWVELTAGIGHEIGLAALTYSNNRFGVHVTGECLEFDVGLGASGSEVVATTFRTRLNGSSDFPAFNLPAIYPVDANTRVAVRVRQAGTEAVSNLRVSMLYYDDIDLDPCADGGEITIASDPASGEVFTGRTIRPRAWLTLAYDDANRSLALDSSNRPTLRAAGNLVRFGSIQRQLSDRSSPYKMASVTIDVDDTSRLLSTLEAATATQHWANREGRIFLASDTTIAAAGTPHTLFRGIWRGHRSHGLQRSLTFTDILGSEFSDLNLEGPIPKRLITLDDFPNAPDAAVGQPVPIAYGNLSDQSIVTTQIGTTAPFDATLPAISTAGCANIGTAGTINGNCTFIVCGVKAGAEGPISNPAGTANWGGSFRGLWRQDPTFDSYNIYFFGGDGAWLDWTPQGGARLGAYVAFARKFTHDNATLDMPDAFQNMYVEISNPTDGADALTGVATSSVDQGKGVIAPRYLGITALSDGDNHTFLLDGASPQDIAELYVYGVPVNIATDAAARAPWKIPGFSEWTAEFGTAPYRDINGHRYNLIYGRAGYAGPDQAAGIIGALATVAPNIVPFAVNYCAIEDVGDGSGRTITAAPRQAFHLLDQWILQDYQTGAWASSALSDDGVPWLNSGSFAALEAIEIARIGGAGYQGAIYIDQPMTVRELLGKLFTSFDMHFGQNKHGQVIAIHLDDFTDLTTTRQISDFRDLVDDTDIDRRLEELENTIVVDWKWRQASTTFEEIGLTLADDLAIGTASPPTGNRGRVATGDRRQLYYVRHEATATDVGGRALARGKYPPRYVEMTCTLHSLPVELGDVIRVTDVDGIGATGWVDRALFVVGIEDQINDLTTAPVVKLTCEDVERFLATSGVMGDRGTLVNWSTETAPNKVTYYYMANRTTGTFADGSPAKEMR